MTVATVLVLDDDAALLRMLRATLMANGCSVVTAQHGRDGLERLAESQPDVIVLDLQMPVMDGRAFYREMRARGITTPTVLLSAHGATEAKTELGAEAAVNKPFDPDHLMDVIRRLIAA